MMISVKEALETVLHNSGVLEVVEVATVDALGMVLAQDVVAARNVPPFDNSAMDGYALLATDTKGASKEHPCCLPVKETIPAGAFSQKTLVAGEAVRIMTGAPIPQGATAMVRFEDTDTTGEMVKIFIEAAVGEHIRHAGEDIHKGEMIFKRGAHIRSAGVGMLASLGIAKVSVYRRPVVAVVVTGDEIAELGEAANNENKIINSNAYTLIARLKEMGVIPLYLGIARDTQADLRDKFDEALLAADVLITSGGVSAGDYDFVEGVWRDMGAQILFSEVAQRPGKPMVFGRLGSKLLFGLPGNPVSTMVAFEVYVFPALLKMLGRCDFIKRHLPAILGEELTKKRGLTYFLRGIFEKTNIGLKVMTTGAQGSGILKSMVIGNCLLVLPSETTLLKSGEPIGLIPLDDSFLFMPESDVTASF